MSNLSSRRKKRARGIGMREVPSEYELARFREEIERAELLAILKQQVSEAGLTGAALQEVYERLDATDTLVLRDCVQMQAVRTAQRLANDNSVL